MSWTPRKRIWLVVIGAIAGVASLPLLWIAFVIYVAQPVRFEGTSMMPTYRDGDRLLLGKWASELSRGDVVAFNYPRDPSKSMLKRIVGLPGEELAIRGGTTYIDGQALDEPYLSAEFTQHSKDIGPVVIPAGQYFVMGDNRDHSNDSRQWGTVSEHFIYGTVVMRYG